MTIECYDQLADAYAERAEQSRVSIKATLNEYLLPLMKSGGSFLDVGCAVGVATEEAALAGMQAVGVDSAPTMIKIATRDRVAGEFHCWDYLQWKFMQKDAILAFAFIHLFPKHDARDILRKMQDELKPGGYLYTGTTKETESREGWEEKTDYGFPNRPHPMPKRYRARYTAEEYESLVLSVGFEKVMFNEHEDEFGKLWRDVLVRRPA